MIIDLNILGERLKQIRKNTGLSRKFIYEKYGIPIGTIRKLEGGQADPKLSTIVQYIQVFARHGVHISLDSLVDTRMTNHASKLNNS